MVASRATSHSERVGCAASFQRNASVFESGDQSGDVGEVPVSDAEVQALYRLRANEAHTLVVFTPDRTGTYNLPEAKAFRLLVENVEALVSDDNASWMQGRRESEQKPREHEPDLEAPAPAPRAP